MQPSSPHRNKLTRLVMIALIAGIAVGAICHHMLPNAEDAKRIAGYFSICTDIFLRLVKMIIAPLVFATIVSGIASLGNGAAVGRIAGKALVWFITASLTSLALGLFLANLFDPGAGMSLAVDPHATGSVVPETTLSLHDFFTHIVPTSAVQAMASNEIIQILVFSTFFGFALSSSEGGTARHIGAMVEELVHVMLRVTNSVMGFAPLGVFAAMAAVITTQGLGVLATYGKLILSFYIGLATLWLLLLAAGAMILGRAIVTLLKLLRQPMMLAFSTASSEAAFPKMLEQLSAFGVSRRISAFVLPLGYSFNLDGSMMYQAFATLFIAQAYGIDMTVGRQVALLLLMMVTSKGIAGVPRASLVVVAATLPFSGLPPEGLMLIFGIDQLLDMGRTVTNVIGNGVATAVVAKWEGELAAPDHGPEAL